MNSSASDNSGKLKASGPIGIFDSGVGGLSVLRHIATQLPDEELVYFADSGFAGAFKSDAEADNWMAGWTSFTPQTNVY